MTVYDYYLSGANISENVEEQKLMIGIAKKKIKDKSKENNYIYFLPTKKEDIQNLPQNSTLIKISFTLMKPYTSKDKGEFHLPEWNEKKSKKNEPQQKIIENPIVRDKFTGLPVVKPSTWKGHLRFAARKVEWDEGDNKKIVIRLFGSESGKEDTLKGRLYFFPTFFEKEAKRDVITPLKRDTRTPTDKAPIPFEVIKPESKGEFYLLYFPYPKGENYNQNQVYEDLIFLAEALKLMFYTYGFSAKKTSGFGIIEDNLKEGKFWVKVGTDIQAKPFSQLDELSKIIDKLGLK